jgi:hypothetical protein
MARYIPSALRRAGPATGIRGMRTGSGTVTRVGAPALRRPLVATGRLRGAA